MTVEESVLNAVRERYPQCSLLEPPTLCSTEFIDRIRSVVEVEIGQVWQVSIASPDPMLIHVSVSQDSCQLLIGTCQVTFDELPVSQFIEYCFDEDLLDRKWRMTPLVEDALQEYKSKAFASWEEQLLKPSCEAAFKRLLNAGPVSRIFDKFMFPTPPELSDKYTVVSESNGKQISLPHPVNSLRVWDAKQGGYREIDATLDGAPKGVEETNKYFEKIVQGLKDEMGDYYIDSLMNK